MKIRNNAGRRTVPWGIPDFGIAIWMRHRSVEHIVHSLEKVGEPFKDTVVKTNQSELLEGSREVDPEGC